MSLILIIRRRQSNLTPKGLKKLDLNTEILTLNDNLDRLDLENLGTTDDSFSNITILMNLNNINCSNSSLTNVGLKYISKFNLFELILNDTLVSNLSHISNMKNLKKLILFKRNVFYY